jgi:hypothetical protein
VFSFQTDPLPAERIGVISIIIPTWAVAQVTKVTIYGGVCHILSGIAHRDSCEQPTQGCILSGFHSHSMVGHRALVDEYGVEKIETVGDE